jgi:Ca2+-binding RTX toxin-like protein
MAAASVSELGDLNGDGFGDILIGAVYAGPGDCGTSYVVYGSMPGEAVVRTGTNISNTIHGGSFGDTLTGLNGNDVLIGHDGGDLMFGGANDDGLFGDAGKDTLEGGGGRDVLDGGTGKDILDGGPGGDIFAFASASHSTGKKADTLKNADFLVDAVDLEVAVTGVDATIGAGKLRKKEFDADLAKVADASHLGAGHAVLFTASQGDFAGKTFLIVDLNGEAGYQARDDLVVLLANPGNLNGLGIEDFL